MIDKLQVIEIFTDGACKGNPGPGGWGALIRYGKSEKEIWGGEKFTTNNRMELMAAIQSLAILKRPCKVKLTTDSDYLRKGITEWIKKWKINGWRNGDKKPVKNQDLWMQLDEQAKRHEIEWHWIRGHTGHPENERADVLANHGVDQLMK